MGYAARAPAATPYLFLLFSVTPSAASAADWYVDPTAPSGGDGSQARPFTTINSVKGVLQCGDTVWLASGTYDEVVNLSNVPGTSGTTTFRALPGATPVIDGSSSTAIVFNTTVPSVTLQDLTIQNALGEAAIQFDHADHGSVINCTMKNVSGRAAEFYYSSYGTAIGSKLQGGISGRRTTGMVVQNNEIYNARAEGVAIYNGSINANVSHNLIHDNGPVNLYLDSISYSTFDGNLIYETSLSNSLVGIELSDECYPELLASGPVNSHNTIINNVLYGNRLGIVFWWSGTSQGNGCAWTLAQANQSGLRYDTIANNTVVDSHTSVKWDASPAHVGTTIQNNIVAVAAGLAPWALLQANDAGGGGIALDHNLWYAPDQAQPFAWVGTSLSHAAWVTATLQDIGVAQGSGDVLADPLFAGSWIAPPATNLDIGATSPAAGVGVSVPGIGDDYLGMARPSVGVDIGAFQQGATTPAPDAGSEADAGGSPRITPDAGSDADAGGSSGEIRGGCACSTNGTPQLGLLALLGQLVAGWRARPGRRVARRSSTEEFQAPSGVLTDA